METPFGRCLCGRTRFYFDRDAPTNFHLCHCETCRRATGAPVAAYFTVRDSAWRWKGQPAATYSQGDGVTRGFCSTCGTPIFRRSDDRPGETDFLAATLANPAEFAPERAVCQDQRLHWLTGIEELAAD